MSPAVKWKKRVSHQIMGFQMSLKGRSVATTLVLIHISSESLWKPEGIVRGLTWETLSWSLYLGHPVKVIAIKVDVGFLTSPGPRLLEKLLMYSEFSE